MRPKELKTLLHLCGRGLGVTRRVLIEEAGLWPADDDCVDIPEVKVKGRLVCVCRR